MMIQMKDVVFRYREKARRNILDHVDLDIRENTLSVIMGASGCGKSTLAAVMAGLYPENGGFLEQGEILLDGRDVRAMNPQERAACLSVMFQNPDLQFCMDTLRREMRFCLENIRVPAQQMDARILETARDMGMEHLLDSALHSLSGGEKQKAALCCLAVLDSRCILLDEPFANIDPACASELAAMLAGLRARGRTVVVIDHQPDLWTQLADEFIVLGEGGRVLRRGFSGREFADQLPLFEAQGLFYPRARRRIAADSGNAPDAVTLEGVSIPKGIPRRRLLKRLPCETLLENVSVSFPRGRMTAVLGPSGSGKTTTFLSILRQHPYTGVIRLNGQDVARLPRRQLYRRVGIVFQNPANQFITQNVLEEVTQSLRLWHSNASATDCEARAQALLADYGLSRCARYSPYMLSQGQQRRLAVLSVLCGGQEVLFLDEPTYGQDDRSTTAIMEQLRARVCRDGLTVVFITHDAALAHVWADRIYRLQDKQLIREEQP